jgi:ABC-type nitrate/sulfonate/bicarbonate transport system substrate-binding protein/predicted transcriptional regulator
MDWQEFPVLSAADESHIKRLSAGMGDDPSRVFVYLWLRSLEEDVEPTPATEMMIYIGTGLSRKAVQDALVVLEDRGLVESQTVETSTPGRPPKAWKAAEPLPTILDRVYDQHARQLVERSQTIANCTSGDARFQSSTGAITVALNWYPNGLQLPLYAARANGSYEKRGLSVDLEPFKGSRRATEAVLSGEATVGIVGAATVTRSRSGGEPLVPVATLFQRPMVVLFTTRERFGERLVTVDQLRGHRVGMPTASETSLLGRVFLAQAGVLDDVDIVEIDGEETAALKSDQVDVVTGVFADPLRLESAEVTVDSIHVADRYPVYGPTLVTSDATLEQQQEEIEAILAGTTAGWIAARRDPGTVAEHVPETSGRSPDEVASVFERAAVKFGETEETSQYGWGWQTESKWRRLETALAQTDLLENTP